MLSVVNNPYGDLLTYWPAILISIIIVIVPGIKHVGVLITTLVHEIGHGLVALPFGGFSTGVNISGDGGGSMNSGKLFKPVQIVMLLSGYGFPVHLGLALIVAAHYNFTVFINVVLGLLTLVLLVTMRSWFTVFVGLLFLTTYVLFCFATPIMEIRIGYAVIVGGVLFLRGILEIVLASHLVFGTDDDFESDFEILEDEAFFDRKFWYIFMIACHVSIIVSAGFIVLPLLT